MEIFVSILEEFGIEGDVEVLLSGILKWEKPLISNPIYRGL